MNQLFYKMDAFNFVPIKRTPWGGAKISALKKKYFPENNEKIPQNIGESWEVSTDEQFPSFVYLKNNEKVTLKSLLQNNAQAILGKNTSSKYGAHSPLLLKWLNANDLLSVQLHPNNGNSLLKSNECGKPESWLVLDTDEAGFVYLGFQENLTKEQIVQYLLNDEPEKCLYRYEPKVLDYISVPAGCVHAVGTGVFVAEPQYVLPEKSGKTWRISDWRRLYDDNGMKSSKGIPRELHVEESLQAIDWSLPRGKKLEEKLVQNMQSNKPFYGDENNPFALQVFCEKGKFQYDPLIKDTFSVVTVWAGEVILKCDSDTLIMHGGESALVSSEARQVTIQLTQYGNDKSCAAFFAFNDEVF
ncbi:type I phosphomannose isomerase catalytic subunit [Fluviispira vulneris]|uniref:type I phosphomannose isomerase catalytic subunit n=1 Tax=Fluviispira vulneris TaxID=2763012 RepID=UPI0016487FC8|nr:type I phosphomannose isomerase catalytic subunit [Fluviispira vulneris]